MATASLGRPRPGAARGQCEPRSHCSRPAPAAPGRENREVRGVPRKDAPSPRVCGFAGALQSSLDLLRPAQGACSQLPSAPERCRPPGARRASPLPPAVGSGRGRALPGRGLPAPQAYAARYPARPAGTESSSSMRAGVPTYAARAASGHHACAVGPPWPLVSSGQPTSAHDSIVNPARNAAVM